MLRNRVNFVTGRGNVKATAASRRRQRERASETETVRVSLEEVRQIACPDCGANAGQRCRVERSRDHHHSARVTAAEAQRRQK